MDVSTDEYYRQKSNKNMEASDGNFIVFESSNLLSNDIKIHGISDKR